MDAIQKIDALIQKNDEAKARIEAESSALRKVKKELEAPEKA